MGLMIQMQHNIIQHRGDGNVHFIPSLFNDTLKLLFDAHNYFDYEGYEDQQFLPEELQLIFSNEMSRVTMRLTSIMAWLMIRKASYEGKVDEEIEPADYRLEARDICLVENKVHHAILPPYMVQLLDETYAIYCRVMRLDDAETHTSQQVH